MASESSDENTIQLDNLSLEQLDQLRQQEEGRMQALRQRYAELRQASGRISASQTAVRNLKATEAETEAFVPLSESVYIPGKIRPHGPEEKDLLVELGTGFFVEKTADGALAFLDRKKRLVDGNSDNGRLR
jgi:prefoldin alpha subunit